MLEKKKNDFGASLALSARSNYPNPRFNWCWKVKVLQLAFFYQNSNSIKKFVRVLHENLVVESDSLNVISWISSSVIPTWRFQF